MTRMLTWYMHSAMAARRVLLPHGYEIPTEPADSTVPPQEFPTHDDALRWLEEERTNLVAATDQAADRGQDAIAWKCAYALAAFFTQHWHPDDWLETLHIGLAAALRLNDPSAHALILIGLGERASELRKFDQVVKYYMQALPIAQKADERWSEGFCRSGLGEVNAQLGRFDQAIDYLEYSIRIFRDIGNRRGEGIGLTNLGSVYRQMGRIRDAITCHQQAMPILKETGNHDSLAVARRHLGNAYHDLQQFDDAIQYYQQALKIFRERKSQAQIARVLAEMGEAQLAAGQTHSAQQSWRDAAAILNELNHPNAEDLYAKLSGLTTPTDPSGNAAQ
jgi:tetratricopeptide (TPR) repeat protein